MSQASGQVQQGPSGIFGWAGGRKESKRKQIEELQRGKEMAEAQARSALEAREDLARRLNEAEARLASPSPTNKSHALTPAESAAKDAEIAGLRAELHARSSWATPSPAAPGSGAFYPATSPGQGASAYWSSRFPSPPPPPANGAPLAVAGPVAIRLVDGEPVAELGAAVVLSSIAAEEEAADDRQLIAESDAGALVAAADLILALRRDKARSALELDDEREAAVGRERVADALQGWRSPWRGMLTALAGVALGFLLKPSNLRVYRCFKCGGHLRTVAGLQEGLAAPAELATEGKRIFPFLPPLPPLAGRS